jgi:hypothetical protein
VPGDYYPLNLREPPFNIPTLAMETIDEHSEALEGPAAFRIHMLLFNLSQLVWDDELTWLEDSPLMKHN